MRFTCTCKVLCGRKFVSCEAKQLLHCRTTAWNMNILMQLPCNLQAACMDLRTLSHVADDDNTGAIVLEVRERKWWQNNLEVGTAPLLKHVKIQLQYQVGAHISSILRDFVPWNWKRHLACRKRAHCAQLVLLLLLIKHVLPVFIHVCPC